MSKFKKIKYKSKNKKKFNSKFKDKTKKKPFITIITVVKNDKHKILRTLKSVFKQTYKNFEYIVVDGKSTDGTINILQNNITKIDHLIIAKDANMWDAMNKGIKKSSGSIIGILNSGDIFYKNTLKIVKKSFIENDIDYLFGPVKKDRIWYKFNPEKIFYRFNIYPSHSIGFFISSKVQKKIGLYDIKFNFGADYDLFYRLFKKKYYKGYLVNKRYVFGNFDMHGYSSKIPFYLSYFYEMKIRHKNKQNIIYLFFLYLIKILNKFRNILIFYLK